MRWLWAILVTLVVGYLGFDTFTSLTRAQSAVQVSQLYDRQSAWFLGLIALTLVWEFAARGHEAGRRHPDTPATVQPVAPPLANDTPSPAAVQTVPSQAVPTQASALPDYLQQIAQATDAKPAADRWVTRASHQ